MATLPWESIVVGLSVFAVGMLGRLIIIRRQVARPEASLAEEVRGAP